VARQLALFSLCGQVELTGTALLLIRQSAAGSLPRRPDFSPRVFYMVVEMGRVAQGEVPP